MNFRNYLNNRFSWVMTITYTVIANFLFAIVSLLGLLFGGWLQWYIAFNVLWVSFVLYCVWSMWMEYKLSKKITSQVFKKQ